MLRATASPLVVFLTLLLSACGGDSGGGGDGASTADAGQVAERAAERLDSVRSGRIDASLRAEVAFGIKQRLVLTETGPFADARGTELPNYALELSVAQGSALGTSDNAAVPQRSGIVFDGSALYVRPPGSSTFAKRPASAVVANRSKYEEEQKALGSGRIPLLGLTPGDWVSSARFAGETTVDGEPARRIVGTLDLKSFLADLRQAKANEFGLGIKLTGGGTKLEGGGEDAKVATKTIELLVGKTDGRLRRLRARLDANVSNLPDSASQGTRDTVGRVQVDLDIDLTGLDKPQSITAPTVG